MGYIFSGYLLVLFNFTITIENFAFDIFPDFIGYFLIYRGIKYFISVDEYFKKALPFSTFLIIYSVFYFIVHFLGFGDAIAYFMIVMNIFSLGAMLYMTYLFLSGMKSLEQKYKKEFNAISTYNVFTILAVFEILSYVVAFFDVLFATIMLLATIITAIVFFYQLFYMKKFWKAQM